MLILPIHTDRMNAGTDIAETLLKNGDIQSGDVIVISSKVVAIAEGAAIDLSSIVPSKDAMQFAGYARQAPEFSECVLRETKRMNGEVLGTCPYAMLTSLKPDGMTRGRILCPNAGLDLSNVEDGYAIGWPIDPVQSCKNIRKKLEQSLGPNAKIGVILSDSCCTPGRLGVTAFALVSAGIEPMKSEIGAPDLFGAPLKVTREASADQLATSANAVMGNAGQSIPAAIVRDSGLSIGTYLGWVSGIDPEEDLFQGLFKVIR